MINNMESKNKAGLKAKIKRIVFVGSVLLMFIYPCFTDVRNDGEKRNNKYAKTIEYVDELIQDEMDSEDIVGLSIALVDDQEIVWAKGYGMADLGRKLRTTPKTVYSLGSISEIFTSPAVMLLQEKGLIDADQPVTKYIPEFAMKSRFPDSKPIKIRNLISHHSGIQSEILKGQYASNPGPFSGLLQLLKNEYVCYPPEFVFSFSKAGLTLLGILVERVSNTDFHEFLEKNIFEPASMTESAAILNENIKLNLSKVYGEDEAEDRIIPSRDIPADRLYSSVSDLGKYMMMFFNKGKVANHIVFKPETVEKILSPADQEVPLDLDLRQGSGWVLSCLGEYLGYAGKIAWHDNSSGAFKGRVIMLLDHKLGVAVLSNTGSATGSVQKIAVETIKSALEEKKGIKQPEWIEPDLEDSFPEAYMKSCAGDYATSAGVIPVTRKGDDLYAEVMGRRILLKPNANKNFSGRILLLGLLRIKVGPLSSLEFSFGNYEGRDIIALHRFGERFLAGEKIKPFKLPDAWLKRLGNYNVINNDQDLIYVKSVRLAFEEGKFSAYYKMNDDDEERERKAALMPASDTEAYILGLGRHMGETISIEKSEDGEQLKYSGYIFKKK
jgi:CubicO group peptidase (beta-lactamase class C family)